MSLITCPICKGKKFENNGTECWGCNGYGMVEATSDEEADVVLRGGRLVDRGTNKSGDQIILSSRVGCIPMIILVVIIVVVVNWLVSTYL